MARGGLGKGSSSSLEQEVESLRRRVAELEAAASRHSSAEQQIRKLNADLKRSFDDAPIGLCYLDTDLRYVHINEWLAQINGLPVAAHLGKTIGEVLPKVAAGVEAQFRQVIATGQPIIAGTVVSETPAHPGVERIFEHYYYADVGADGAPVGISCVVLDVTRRRRNEEDLRRWAHVFEHAEMAVVVTTPDGTIELVTPAVARMYGTSGERLVSKSIAHLYAPQVRKEVARYSRRANEEGHVSFESKHIRHDGTVFDVRVTVTAVRDKQGEVSYRVANIEDITERKELEARRLEVEAARHREALAHVTRVISLGELQGTLAHELNQPLTAILSNAQTAVRLLDQESLDIGELREILSDVIEDDRRAGEVIRRVRAMMTKTPPTRVSVSINDQIRKVLDLVRSELLIKGVRGQLDLESELPRTVADPVQIQQVVMNLIMNSVEAVVEEKREAPNLTVSSQSDGSNVTVSVQDNGGGIAKTDLPKLFDSFHTSKPDGLGMGLSICRNIVEAHGGQIWVARTSRKGTTLSFSLPIDKDEAP